jgi:hypothetical protein
MQVGRIRDSNFIYRAPQGMPDCLDLHVHVTDTDGMRIITSAWIPTPEEVKRIAAGQPVYLHVYGHGHPVVSMSVPVDDPVG